MKNLNNPLPALAAIIGLLAYLFVLASPGSYLFCDPDTLMHLSAGRWIFEHRLVPSFDPFSFNTAGKVWVDHEWLAQLLMFFAVHLDGLAGLRLLMAALLGITFAIELQFLIRRVPPIYALLFCALTCACLMGHLLARPHIFTWPIIALWFTKLFDSVEGSESRPPYWLSLLLILWANLHGSFILGLATIPFFALEALMKVPKVERREVLKNWSIFFVIASCFSLATPYGFQGIAFGANLISSEYISRIIEWAPTSGTNLHPIEFWLLLILSLSLFGKLKLSLARLLLLLGLLHEAFAHVRYVSIFGLVAPLILAVPFNHFYQAIQLKQGSASRVDLFFARLCKPINRSLLLGLALLAVFAAGIAQYAQENASPETNAPLKALEAAKEQGASGHVLNYWNFGGFLISQNIPVFIDGRADLYGDKYVDQYFELTDSVAVDKIRTLLEENQIQWSILPPTEKIVLYLNTQKDWKRVYEDKNAVVHVKIR